MFQFTILLEAGLAVRARRVRGFLIPFLFLSSVLLFSLSLFRCQISLAWVTTSLEITHKVVLHNLDINHT
jgi:hypothetical protein